MGFLIQETLQQIVIINVFLAEDCAGKSIYRLCKTFDGILGHNIGVNISPLSCFHVIGSGNGFISIAKN